ncbi:MAG: TraR/DksA C4-type zinc finger protein [Candidatus Nanopelagicales bacterium]
MVAKKIAAKAPARKAAPAKKAAPVKKAAAPVKKSVPAKKPVPAKKVAAPVKKAPARKVAPVKKAAAPVKAVPVKAVPVAPAARPVTAPAKKAGPVKKAAPKRQLAPDGKPMVREDESPWTPAELKGVRAALLLDIKRLEDELENAEAGLADLIRDSGEGAGDDQADAGSKTFEREHEMSLANNAREMLLQVTHAIHRLDDGSYGACESCGKPIGKYRLQAFPRATLCLACKQVEERQAL